MTSRERVRACLAFRTPDRMPRHIWTVPWAVGKYGRELKAIQTRFPEDICWATDVYDIPLCGRGDPYAVGTYTDEWGCVFENRHGGIIGEVKKPLLETWEDAERYQPPFYVLPADEDAARERVNRFCSETDLFVLSGCGPRPWERYQFLRGTENALMDLMLEPELTRLLLRKIHGFYLKEVEFWASTDVDGIFFQDDWGSQQSLLVSPDLWREFFKPFYKEYIDLAHAQGRATFMHSDGNIQSIYPDLIDIGLDAVNSQLACMDLDELMTCAKGRITFWGELDRQHVLTSNDPLIPRQAVREIASHLYDSSGGMIAQLSFDLGVVPRMVETAFEEWNKIEAESGRRQAPRLGTGINEGVTS